MDKSVISKGLVSSIIDYHERSKHSLDAYAPGPETIDWNAQPDPFRRFEGSPLQPLPLDISSPDITYNQLTTQVPESPVLLTVDSVSQFLFYSLGLSAWKQYGTDRWSLRCNPSSGNLHPTECYLISSGIENLSNGVHHYRVDEHGLERRCMANQPLDKNEKVLMLALTSVHWREAWKYGERAFRYCQHDIGHALAAVSMSATAMGWKLTPLLDFSNEQIAHLIGTNRTQDFGKAENEFPDILLQFDFGIPRTVPLSFESLAEWIQESSWYGKANVLDKKHFYSWPIVDKAEQLSRTPAYQTTPFFKSDDLPAPIPSDTTSLAAEVIRKRRSAQAFDTEANMKLSTFYSLLDKLVPRKILPPWSVVPWQPKIHLVFFIHGVEGLNSGLYILVRDSNEIESLKAEMRNEFLWLSIPSCPKHLHFFHLVSANARKAAARLSCHQAIASDSMFCISMLANFCGIDESPWLYRRLFWEAGVIGQILYLEAESRLLRGTGIGCFFDNEVHELFGLKSSNYQDIYHFTIGAALHDPRITTIPPYQERTRSSQ